MRARRRVRHGQLCLFCGVRGDVDLCPRDADGDAANDGVWRRGLVPADTENDADGDCTRGGGVCATAVVSYPYDRMIMPITTPCAATRVPRSSRTCCWRASRHGSCRISSAFGLSGTVGGESHLKSTPQQRWRVRRPRLGPRERRRRRPSGDDAVCDDDDDDDRARPFTLCIGVDHDNTATSDSMTTR